MRTPRLWAKAKGINNSAVLTTDFLIGLAIRYGVDVIVFEYLDPKGKKRGSMKQRLHLWRLRYVQSMVADKMHSLDVRISRVNAWGTSRLAFNGSGQASRGRESQKTRGSWSVCEFLNGKVAEFIP